MKRIIYLILAVTVVSCQRHNKTNLPSISTLANGADFIAVNIVGRDSSSTVIIQKAELFDVLIHNKDLASTKDVKSSVEDCRRIVEEYGSNGKPLHIDEALEKSLKDYILNRDSALDTLLKLPKDQLIAKYFDKNILRSEDIAFPKDKKIIFCLIRSGVRCWRQDYSGAILIENSGSN